MGSLSRPTAEASSVARVPDAGLQRRAQVSDEPVDSDEVMKARRGRRRRKKWRQGLSE